MGFSTDYTDVQSFELIPKGEYEVIIKAITERTTPNGATGLNLTFVIRNDVEGVAEPPPPQGRRLHVLPCRRRRHPRTPLCGRVRRRTHAHDARGDRP